VKKGGKMLPDDDKEEVIGGGGRHSGLGSKTCGEARRFRPVAEPLVRVNGAGLEGGGGGGDVRVGGGCGPPRERVEKEPKKKEIVAGEMVRRVDEKGGCVHTGKFP